VRAVQKAAQGTNLTVLPGMEVQSREEVHLLTLFDDPETLETWQQQVNEALPDLQNQPGFFGEQFVVDETGDFVRNEPRLLLVSTRFSIDEVFERVDALGGLVIPAHVERFSFGLFPTLGLISEKWKMLALEISRHITPQKALATYPALKNYELVQDGDVHQLDDFLGTTTFRLNSPTLAELRLAFQHLNGRDVDIDQGSNS
jgi:hypothetical protein